MFPSLKKLQKEEGEAGRRKFNQYQRYGALAFAVVQAVGQCLYVRPFVDDFSLPWLLESSAVLTAGAMILLYIGGEVLNELKLGNGTSLLIFTNIISSLPSSFGQTLSQAQEKETAPPSSPSSSAPSFSPPSVSCTCRKRSARFDELQHALPGGWPGEEQLPPVQGELGGCDAHHLRVVAVGAAPPPSRALRPTLCSSVPPRRCTPVGRRTCP